ncbi:MAG TPA: GAF domain-containing sensor histidine kinase, partial [Xanthobacteraceae bacterium]|nr:GAF domain-containing sensor histidine kinase [Xanthobacteraceae bacterium]
MPTILDVVCRTTGMGFAAVARVTEDRWIACQVLDNIHFGLPAGGELRAETTLCHEIRQHHRVIVIDNVAEDPTYCNHHTPQIYGLQSYISVPITLPDGRFFGTLCAIDGKPAKLNNPQTIATFTLFAELIAYHLDADDRLQAAHANLSDERKAAELREHFIAVLGHDLRNPVASIDAGVTLLLKAGWNERAPTVLRLMKASAARMAVLIDNVMDFARARLGGGMSLDLEADRSLEETLVHVIDELRAAFPGRAIETTLRVDRPVTVDHSRIAQMFSNLLGNALTHGAEDLPIRVHASTAADQLELAVSNGGEPIPAATMERLFHPFRRGEG